MAVSSTYSGWRYDPANSRLDFYYRGTRVGHLNASGLSLTSGKMTDDVLQASGLSTNLKTGYIPLPLTSWRLIASDDIAAKNAADGGLISLDTDPTLKRVNAATDKNMRIAWAANSVIPITCQIAYPPDLDDTAAVTVNLIVGKDTNTNTTFVMGVAYFEGVGDSNAGGNTAAITETTGQNLKTVVITAANIGAAPNTASIELTPAAHANDAIYLYGAYITYTRKS